jgi:hypothetical protein
VTGRLWLDVPFADKAEAKQRGARWDPRERRWYAPRAGITALDRWLPLPPLPELLPGEDRSFGSGLFVDLVASSCWFTNVRTCVDASSWDRLRKLVYGRAGDRCEACGRCRDPGIGLRLEAHERWAYDQSRGVQVLRRLICLCDGCHGVTHLGRTQIMGHGDQALDHLRGVTGMSIAAVEDHVAAAAALWKQRSARTWSLDLSIITAAGLTVIPPESAPRRNQIAGERWQAERRR